MHLLQEPMEKTILENGDGKQICRKHKFRFFNIFISGVHHEQNICEISLDHGK